MALFGDLLGGWLAKVAVPILLIAAVTGWSSSAWHKWQKADAVSKVEKLQNEVTKLETDNKRLTEWVTLYEGSPGAAAEQLKLLQEQYRRVKEHEKNKPKPADVDDSDVDQSFLDRLFGNGVRGKTDAISGSSKPSVPDSTAGPSATESSKGGGSGK